MLNEEIQHKILSVLQGYVLSTSMVARKTKLSRITVSKYLNAMQGKNLVHAVRVGKAVAWRTFDHKPVIAILAKPGTARMVKLAHSLFALPFAVSAGIWNVPSRKNNARNPSSISAEPNNVKIGSGTTGSYTVSANGQVLRGRLRGAWRPSSRARLKSSRSDIRSWATASAPRCGGRSPRSPRGSPRR